MTQIHQIYLPLERDLDYETHIYMNGKILENQIGDIFLDTNTVPNRKIFYAHNQKITLQELQKLQEFYHEYYYQKFYFKDPILPQKTLSILEAPNDIVTQFTLKNNTPNFLYHIDSAKISQNNQAVNNAIVTQDLNIIFETAPPVNSVITALIDYDYAVMFNYQFGLQVISDNDSQYYKISFQLLTC